MSALLMEGGELEEALAVLEKTLRTQVGLYGRDHKEVAATLNRIGIVHEQESDFDLALTFYSQAGEVYERGNAAATECAVAKVNMANVHLKLGDIQQALTLLVQAYTTQRADLPLGHPHLAATARNLGCAHLAKGDSHRALRYLSETQHGN
ncbi:hypothetical protein T484DRAFT_1818795 [Baffinella frigidus]|nr:hypothetical protein T484DRAFT_1818795 [Cryptophyta sp. CCMP2293]